jgi:hypothetical protein
MFWTLKLSFDVEILAFFVLPTVLATLSKYWAFFLMIWSHCFSGGSYCEGDRFASIVAKTVTI